LLVQSVDGRGGGLKNRFFVVKTNQTAQKRKGGP
tara:strand:+ start:71504 stop:71605 length:102 start_codon:yes stop_codon:yes gene_type:complete